MRVTPMVLGLKVRDFREKSGLSQDDLAQKAGVSRRWLSDFENGKRTVDLSLVLRVLDALELELTLSKDRHPSNALRNQNLNMTREFLVK